MFSIQAASSVTLHAWVCLPSCSLANVGPAASCSSLQSRAGAPSSRTRRSESTPMRPTCRQHIGFKTPVSSQTTAESHVHSHFWHTYSRPTHHYPSLSPIATLMRPPICNIRPYPCEHETFLLQKFTWASSSTKERPGLEDICRYASGGCIDTRLISAYLYPLLPTRPVATAYLGAGLALVRAYRSPWNGWVSLHSTML